MNRGLLREIAIGGDVKQERVVFEKLLLKAMNAKGAVLHRARRRSADGLTHHSASGHDTCRGKGKVCRGDISSRHEEVANVA